MKRYWLTGALGLVGILALLAAACAPATQEKAPAPAAQQPAAQQPAAEKPAAEKPAAQQPAAAQPAAPAKPKASVSGIPLEADAKFGGVMRMAYTTEGPTFSPWEETIGTGFSVGQPVSNMLIQPRTWGTEEDYKNRAYFQFAPDLATSWEQAKDGLSWTLKLRDGVKWPDGVAFTCADAKWSLDSIRTGQGLKRSPRGTHYRPIKEIQCADNLTMVINLNWAAPSMLEKIGMPYTMVFPKHIYENDTDSLRTKPPIASGPFVVKERLPSEKVTLVRKADYWDQPFPYLDGIEQVYLATAAVPAALRSGRLHMGAPLGFNGGQARTLIAECTTCKFYDQVISMDFGHAFYVNHQRPPWNSPLILEAISYSMDRNRYVSLYYAGWGSLPTGGGFYPGSYWAMPPERVKKMPGWDFAAVEANKQKARELLAQAGYKPGELKMSITVWKNIEAAIPAMLEDFNSVGFKAEAKTLETAAFFNVMTPGDFELGLHSFFIGGTDPDMMLYEHFYTGSDRNYGRYSNPEVDRLIDLQSQTLDPERRRQIAWDAAELAWRTGAKQLWSHSSYTPIVGNQLRGFMPALNFLSSYGPIQRFQHVWLAEK